MRHLLRFTVILFSLFGFVSFLVLILSTSFHALPVGISKQDKAILSAAFEVAQKGLEEGEPPVGAILTIDGKQVASAYPAVFEENDFLFHAEVRAIRKALSQSGQYNFLHDEREIAIYSTLEPCHMCKGIIQKIGIDRVVWGGNNFTQKALRDYHFGALSYWLHARGPFAQKQNDELFKKWEEMKLQEEKKPPEQD